MQSPCEPNKLLVVGCEITRRSGGCLHPKIRPAVDVSAVNRHLEPHPRPKDMRGGWVMCVPTESQIQTMAPLVYPLHLRYIHRVWQPSKGCCVTVQQQVPHRCSCSPHINAASGQCKAGPTTKGVWPMPIPSTNEHSTHPKHPSRRASAVPLGSPDVRGHTNATQDRNSHARPPLSRKTGPAHRALSSAHRR